MLTLLLNPTFQYYPNLDWYVVNLVINQKINTYDIQSMVRYS